MSTPRRRDVFDLGEPVYTQEYMMRYTICIPVSIEAVTDGDVQSMPEEVRLVVSAGSPSEALNRITALLAAAATLGGESVWRVDPGPTAVGASE